jgi:predicted TIM-barrel fold metal-dependent hydrolase
VKLTRREVLSALGAALAGCGRYTPARHPKVLNVPSGSAPGERGLEGGERILADRAAPTEAPAAGPFIVDLHCHTFNARDIPIDGFIRSIAQGKGMPAFLDAVLCDLTIPFQTFLVNQTELDPGERAPASALTTGNDPLPRLLNRLTWIAAQAPLPGFDAVQDWVKVVATITGSREKMAERLVQANTENGQCRVRLFTPALVDYDYWIRDDKRGPVLGTPTPLEQQIEWHGRVARIAAQGNNPRLGGAKFHPFVAFNPRREISGDLDARGHGPALRIVHRALQEHGFIGVKLYPASGFKPLGNRELHEFRIHDLGAKMDIAMERLFDYCESNEVPILTHASAGNGFKPDAAWRGSPWAWRHVLEKYPKLRVCFGHMGFAEGMEEDGSGLRCVSWAEGFAALMREYDNVYGDVSDSDAALPDKRKRETYQKQYLAWLCRSLAADGGPKLAQRIAYGSDWWLNVREGMGEVFLPNIDAMVGGAMAPACDVLHAAQVDFHADFFGCNALRFLGILDNDGNVRNGAAVARLSKLYAGTRRPAWLTPEGESRDVPPLTAG